jgi:hypothetical protein
MNNFRERIEWLRMYIRSRNTGTLMAYATLPVFIIGGIALLYIGPYQGRPIDSFVAGFMFFSLGLPAFVIVLRREWPAPPFAFLSLKGIPAVIGGLIWMIPMWVLGLIAFWHAIVELFSK